MESTIIPIAVWLGMMMVPPRTNERTQIALRNRNRAEPAEIWKARNYVHEHSEEKLGLRKVAKFANVNANYLSERFKQVTGVNFVDYVARVRFEQALTLLLHGDLRISEIAFAVGFQSLSQFNRVFKKLSGKSPTQYRMAEVKGRGDVESLEPDAK